MPLAYAHFVQILVDFILFTAPLAQYGELGLFSVLSIGILTIFYSGMLDLAKVFLDRKYHSMYLICCDADCHAPAKSLNTQINLFAVLASFEFDLQHSMPKTIAMDVSIWILAF